MALSDFGIVCTLPVATLRGVLLFLFRVRFFAAGSVQRGWNFDGLGVFAGKIVPRGFSVGTF